MMSLSDDKQVDIIDNFNSSSMYLEAILNINNIHFDNMVSKRFNLKKPIPLTPKPLIWICICPFRMILFLSKFTIIMTILIWTSSASSRSSDILEIVYMGIPV